MKKTRRKIDAALGLTEAYADRLKRVLQDLETYVSGQLGSIINPEAARRSAEPLDSDDGERRPTSRAPAHDRGRRRRHAAWRRGVMEGQLPAPARPGSLTVPVDT